MTPFPSVQSVTVDPMHVYVGQLAHDVKEITIESGRFASMSPRTRRDSVRLDARQSVVLPPFVDQHIHGYREFHFWGESTPNDYYNAIIGAAHALPAEGVGAFLPTSITGPDGGHDLLVAVNEYLSQRQIPGAARVLGSHSEGPFLNTQYSGAHSAQHISAISEKSISELLTHGGHALRIVTSSPSAIGFAYLADQLHNVGIRLQFGHDKPSPQAFKAAVEMGVSCATHLFNAMGGLHHRSDDFAAMVLADSAINYELILNEYFVARPWLKIAASLGSRRAIAVSDCIGSLERSTQLNGVEIVEGTGCHVRKSDGAIWAATTGLAKSAALLLEMGADWKSMANILGNNSRRHLGIRPAMTTGDPANLVILDRATGQVQATILDGLLSYISDSAKIVL